MKQINPDGLQTIYDKVTRGSVLNPDVAKLQSELLDAKMDLEDIKALLTSKEDELLKIRSILKAVQSANACCSIAGDFLECYAAVKTKLISEQRLLEGVKDADGQLSMDHHINYIKATIENLDYMLTLVNKCDTIERINKLSKTIQEVLEDS